MDMKNKSYFGKFGGDFIAETLKGPVNELVKAYESIVPSEEFQKTFNDALREYAGRETPLTYARRLTEFLGGAKIYFKREDLLHTGAHKINNAIGQCLLAMKMGKTRIIAETGAGQHGVATATACAWLGLECVVYMGAVDVERQALNVKRMHLLGAKVVPVEGGSKTLKDAINEAMRDWVSNVHDSFYVLGSVLGPYPYPEMVRNFHSCIGKESREQILRKESKLPTEVVACVGGGSNAIGIFSGFIADKDVKLVGVEAGGMGVDSKKHASRFNGGSLGIFHGCKTYLLQNDDGQTLDTHSISAGLDYPAIGPEHANLRDIDRAEYSYATDKEAEKAFYEVSRLEGIIPALETAHALAYIIKKAPKYSKEDVLLVNFSGRGDKDVERMDV